MSILLIIMLAPIAFVLGLGLLRLLVEPGTWLVLGCLLAVFVLLAVQ